MEIVYDESTGKWKEREEPYTTLDVQTEENWNKLEFMIDNFSRLEEENKELKNLLKLAVYDIKVSLSSDRCDNCEKVCAESDCNCSTIEECRLICKWRYDDEVEKVMKEGD